MPDVRIEHKDGVGQILVDGTPVKHVTRVAVEIDAHRFPLVTLELAAFQNAIELSDARLKIGGVVAHEALERAMLEHLQAKYPAPIRWGIDMGAACGDQSSVGIVGESGFEMLVLPVREMSPDPKLFEGTGSTTPAGLCRVATDGERLGRV